MDLEDKAKLMVLEYKADELRSRADKTDEKFEAIMQTQSEIKAELSKISTALFERDKFRDFAWKLLLPILSAVLTWYLKK